MSKDYSPHANGILSPHAFLLYGAQELAADAELIEQMRGVYPGDPHGELARDAAELRDAAEQYRRAASGIEAASADETRSGSAEGESPAPVGGGAQ